ncbi:MAG: von Willebrand factor A [Candidatus Peregrinibacteria bacterium Greene0416_19]|nr:MAG: von Willebrand factor A [Candidatus Peregrinibacteria bacterium Greene0416_19]
MRCLIGLLGVLGILGFVGPAQAAPDILTYRYQHHLFALRPSALPGWRSLREVWMADGREIVPPPAFRVDGDAPPPLPTGVSVIRKNGWNTAAIRETLRQRIGAFLHRDAGRVTVHRTGSGDITFDGVGLTGREVNLELLAGLTVSALEQNVSEVLVPVIETQPEITVTDPSLAELGIKEVITIGESDYSNSPRNRLHNIAVGLNKFNGHLIQPDEVFSFVKVLGPVDGSTGYLKELVIKGDRTVPDYGGGLCQVGTTAYRGVWEYGFPIVQRQNHSYTVSHYFPYGTDATVYPPFIDMKFRNDLKSGLLIQTYQQGDFAYFIYYGTRDGRSTELYGPYTWDKTEPPPDRTEETTDLPPGERKKLNERIPGLKAIWHRIVRTSTGAEIGEPVFSSYEARPLFYQLGVERLPESEPTVEEVNQAEPPRAF